MSSPTTRGSMELQDLKCRRHRPKTGVISTSTRMMSFEAYCKRAVIRVQPATYWGVGKCGRPCACLTFFYYLVQPVFKLGTHRSASTQSQVTDRSELSGRAKSTPWIHRRPYATSSAIVSRVRLTCRRRRTGIPFWILVPSIVARRPWCDAEETKCVLRMTELKRRYVYPTCDIALSEVFFADLFCIQVLIGLNVLPVLRFTGSGAWVPN